MKKNKGLGIVIILLGILIGVIILLATTFLQVEMSVGFKITLMALIALFTIILIGVSQEDDNLTLN